MRIISGRLKGRDLGSVPKGVRPTTDRVRESLFSSLGSVEGLAVLDLFAGTGAFGIEALSRGAARVVFVEKSRAVARALRKRLSGLDLDAEEGVEIIESDALRALESGAATASGGFDLAFLDPPYAETEERVREGAVAALFAGDRLNLSATVVLEGPKGHPLPPLPGVRVQRERLYGDTRLTWLESSRSIKE